MLYVILILECNSNYCDFAYRVHLATLGWKAHVILHVSMCTLFRNRRKKQLHDHRKRWVMQAKDGGDFMKASDLLVRCLEAEGVEYIFGIPGEENIDFMDSLTRSSIQFVLTRHEQGAAFMAD